eukprot:806983-Pleurochrysis_carterae.AAC.1
MRARARVRACVPCVRTRLRLDGAERVLALVRRDALHSNVAIASEAVEAREDLGDLGAAVRRLVFAPEHLDESVHRALHRRRAQTKRNKERQRK